MQISPLITDIYYIVKKELKCKITAMSLMKNLIKNIGIAAVSGNEICRAIDLDWGDFEDAVQYAAGESLAVNYVVTRNTSDFASAALPVVAPDELLSIITGSRQSESRGKAC